MKTITYSNELFKIIIITLNDRFFEREVWLIKIKLVTVPLIIIMNSYIMFNINFAVSSNNMTLSILNV